MLNRVFDYMEINQIQCDLRISSLSDTWTHFGAKPPAAFVQVLGVMNEMSSCCNVTVHNEAHHAYLRIIEVESKQHHSTPRKRLKTKSVIYFVMRSLSGFITITLALKWTDNSLAVCGHLLTHDFDIKNSTLCNWRTATV